MNYKCCFFILTVLCQFKFVAQSDSLKVNNKYWEDQLYLALTYNVLENQPKGVGSSEISYGFSGGYIKDVSLNKSRTLAVGLGLGYSYDYYKNGLLVGDDSFTVNADVSSSTYKFHALEMPLQLRWRTSDYNTYSFWRVYLGVRLNYNLFNTFFYEFNGDVRNSNISAFNRFQNGLELSAGYGAFNLFVYYGLTNVFNDSIFEDQPIETRVLKVGLIFYLL